MDSKSSPLPPRSDVWIKSKLLVPDWNPNLRPSYLVPMFGFQLFIYHSKLDSSRLKRRTQDSLDSNYTAQVFSLLTRLLTSPSSSPVQIAFAPNGCFAMAPLAMNGFMVIARSCSNHEKRREFEKCVTHSNSEFPVTDNLNEMLQLLTAPSKTSAVLYRGLYDYVLLPKLMYALIGAYGAKLSSDSGSDVPQPASAAVVSSSGAAASASVVSQSASAAVVSSSGAASVVSQSAAAAVVSSSDVFLLVLLLLLAHAKYACVCEPIGF